MAAIDDLLLEFGSRSGMGPLARNAEGVCRLVFDGAFVVDVELREEEICLSGVVGPAEDLGPGTLRIMLAANLLGDETGGASLGIDEAEDMVVLSRRLPGDTLSSASFERALGSLVDALQVWRERLAELEEEADAVTREEATKAAPDEMTIFRA